MQLSMLQAVMVVFSLVVPFSDAAENCFGPPTESNVNASAGCEDVAVGGTCAYACDRGYIPAGTAECQGDDVYILEALPACNQTCDVRDGVVGVDYATVTRANCSRGEDFDVQEGDTCTFACTDGETLFQGIASTATCTAGVLTPNDADAFCALPCSSSPPIMGLDFAATSCAGTAHNATCSLVCATNFSTAGNATAHCWDGRWQNMDYCAAQCDGTPAVSVPMFATNASSVDSCTDAPHGTLCPFMCEDSFLPVSTVLSGKTAPRFIECVDGEWETQNLECEAPCYSTPFIRFSYLSEPECNGTMSGDTCSFTCEDPFVPHGDAVCDDGRWQREICGPVYELASEPQCSSNQTRHPPTFDTCQYAINYMGLFNESTMTLEAVEFSTLPHGCYRFDETRFYFNSIGVDDYVNGDGNTRQSICIQCGELCDVVTTTTTTTSTTSTTTTTTTTVNCGGEWEAWSTCDYSCGGGNQSRTFTVFQDPVGGAACPSDEYRACATQACPVDCTGDWGAWSACSGSCTRVGTGTTTPHSHSGYDNLRTRSFVVAAAAEYGGAECPADEEEVCNTEPCPVDCDGSWGAWAECPMTCTEPTGWGGSPNYRQRDFLPTGTPENGGAECPQPELQLCATEPCTTTTTTTTTLRPCVDEDILADGGVDAAGVSMTGPWPAVGHGELSVINCSSLAGPSVGSYTGNATRQCYDGMLLNASSACIPADCEASMDLLSYGGFDVDGVTPITLRGPWPAVASGNDATIACDLNAGVDEDAFGDYGGTVRRACVAGILGEVEGACVPADCPSEYGGTDAQGVELSAYWPDAVHGGYSYMDCFGAAKFNLFFQLYQWQGNISRFCRAGHLYESEDNCVPLQCSGAILVGDNDLGTAGGQDERGQQIKGPWPATDPLEYSEIDCSSPEGIDYSYLPVDTGDFTGTLTRRCFDQVLEEVSGSCTSGPCKRTEGTTYDAYGTAIYGPWDRWGGEDITTWEDVTIQCSDRSGAAMGLGHGAYTGNLTRQCFAGILMETDGICEPFFECDFMCVIGFIIGYILMGMSVLSLVAVAVAHCIDVGLENDKTFAPRPDTAEASPCNEGRESPSQSTENTNSEVSMQHVHVEPTTETADGKRNAGSPVVEADEAIIGVPVEGDVDVDMRQHYRHAVMMKVETTYGGSEDTETPNSDAAHNGAGEPNSVDGESDGGKHDTAQKSEFVSKSASSGRKALLLAPDPAPMLKNNRVSGHCGFCCCGKVGVSSNRSRVVCIPLNPMLFATGKTLLRGVL